MSTDRDTTRIVRSWLEDGVTALPDRVLDAVLDRVPATPQRRSSWPTRRFADMPSLARFVIAAAAVLVVAVIGYNLLPARTSVGGPGPSPSPATTPTAPTSAATVVPTASATAAGTYRISAADVTLIPYSITVPDGWTVDGGASRGEAFGGTGATVTTWILTHVYGNACNWSGTLVPVADRSAAVAALTAQVGHPHSAPVEMTIGGRPATKIVLTLDEAKANTLCPGSYVGNTGISPPWAGERLWPDPGPDESGGWKLFAGQTTTVYVIDGGSHPMVLMTVRHVDTPAADVAQLDQILASVRFDAAPYTR